jgi:aryl-alcohol dehydrogenase-like predicted oxidoreductase
MEQLDLAGTGRLTTRLGFGCSNLMGSMSRKESIALLDAAWDAGIRHIDVAPFYGWGAAESCVGAFMHRVAGQATVTTKYGRLPPARQSLAGLGRQLARPVLRALPGIKHRLARAANSTLGGSRKASFSVMEARASLDQSRRALQAERIDLWLLHDVAAASLTNPALLDFMRDAVAEGIIGDFGVSHDIAEISALFDQKRGYCRVLQFEWSVRQNVPQFPGSFLVHHRSLAHNYSALRAELERRPEMRRGWSDELDCDIGSPEKLAALMLKAALLLNPNSIVLVSSKSPVHIVANVRAAEDGTLDDTARRFYKIVQRDLNSLRQESATGAEPARI